MTYEPHTNHETAVEALGDEYEQELIHEAIDAIEDADAQPTVERVEAVLGDVDSEIARAVAAVEELTADSAAGGECA